MSILEKRMCNNCGKKAVIEEWGFMKLTRPNGEELYEDEALYSVCENCDAFSMRGSGL